MQVNRIQAKNCNNQPNFKALIITENGARALRKTFNTEQLEQITKWKKELENTKHFDLKISTIADNLFYVFKNKTNPKFDSEAPLHIRSLRGNKLCAYGIDLHDSEEILPYRNLKLPTVQEAQEAYAKLSKYTQICAPYPDKINSFNRLKWAIDSTKILDKATEYTGIENIKCGLLTSVVKQQEPFQTTETVKASKTSIIQRIKNAWKTLKGN